MGTSGSSFPVPAAAGTAGPSPGPVTQPQGQGSVEAGSCYEVRRGRVAVDNYIFKCSWLATLPW